MSAPTAVDHAAIRTGQFFAILILIAAYILNRWEPVAAMAIVFLVGALAPSLSPFTLIYRFVLLPLRLVRADMRVDHTEPHRFGQAVGVVVAAIAAATLYFGYITAGWIITWVLIVLTIVSFAGWCAGCFVYFTLNRLGLGGFFRHSPTDTSVIRGGRPRTRSAQ